VRATHRVAMPRQGHRNEVAHTRWCCNREPLEFTRDTVEQVALAAGYEDASGFRRTLKHVIELSSRGVPTPVSTQVVQHRQPGVQASARRASAQSPGRSREKLSVEAPQFECAGQEIPWQQVPCQLNPVLHTPLAI
jgi:hypothetical protein